MNKTFNTMDLYLSGRADRQVLSSNLGESFEMLLD